MVTRLLISCVFDICEEEEDAEGLRALRRTMVPYFLAKSPGKQMSKYASFTMTDLIVELSASERTKKRMDLYVAINPSGVAGGGLFRDKHEEHSVQKVKRCLKNTHGGIDDIKLEKEIGALTVISDITQHDKRSLLRGKIGKEHSRDMIGMEVRNQIEENVAKVDPFCRTRDARYDFYDKSRGGVYAGVTEEALVKFIESRKKEFKLKSRFY